MGRAPRIEFKGAFYHVMCRGNRQEAVFPDEADKVMFFDTLAEACERTGWRVHAFCLMGNHYHLLIETPFANLVDGMRRLQSTFTKRFNMRHQQWGHLFQSRYKALLVDPHGDYFKTVRKPCQCTHLNISVFGGRDGAAGAGSANVLVGKSRKPTECRRRHDSGGALTR